MSRKPPSESKFMNQLLMENNRRNAALAQETAAYSADLARMRSEADAAAAARAKAMEDEIAKKATTPVTLGTLLTSNAGILGNPVLSVTKLSG